MGNSTDEPIIDPFDPSKIDITMKQMSLYLLITRIKEEEINMFTEFQRKGDLWSDKEQSRLIESIMTRIPLPAFYFDGTDDGNWLIIDGLQRLTALKKFVIDENLKLENLEYLTKFNGYTFSELPRPMQRRIEESEVIVYRINPGTPSDVKYNIFKRINTGGLTLEPQEIRNALNQGIPAEFLKKLADSSEFERATAGSINSDRMKDREFVLRFLAFNLTHYSNYPHDLDNFLNETMEKLKEIGESKRNELETKFKKAMSAAANIFDDDAFRKRYNRQDHRNPINKALFEAWSVNLSNLNDEELNKLCIKKEDVIDKFIQLMNNDKDFEKSITSATSDKSSVKERFNKIKNLIEEVL